MSSKIQSMLGVTPSLKMIHQMNEKLINNDLVVQFEEKSHLSTNKDMVSIPITTSFTVPGKKQVSKWEWSKFKNNARSDSLQLSHWTKKLNFQSNIDFTNAEPSDNNSISISNSEISTSPTHDELHQKEHLVNNYYFSKFNRHPMVYSFKSDQYNKYLKDLDPNWSEEDTCLLFELCREYDLRFIIIHDRYSSPSGIQRSLEQLKQRYYSISKKLVEIGFDTKKRSLGNSPDPSALASLKDERNRHPYIRYNYNIDFDRNRRLSLSENYCKNIRKETREIIREFHSRQHSTNKRTFSSSKLLEDLIEIENEIDAERKLISKLKNYDSFGPKKSGATTAGSLCYQYISSLPRKFQSDIENLLKHFRLDTFPLPYLNTEIAEQYCIIRSDLLILLSTRKKLQRLNALKNVWQEKLKNLSQTDDFAGSCQPENEEKGKPQNNHSNRQFQTVPGSPPANSGRTQKPRNKTARNIQEQVQVAQQAHIEDGDNASVSQFTQNSSGVLKRESDSADRPKKKFRPGTSKYVVQHNGCVSQVNIQGSFQGIVKSTQQITKDSVPLQGSTNIDN